MSRAYWISTLSRIFCGIVFLVHGTPKILNLEGTMTWFADNVGIPGWAAVPVATVEFFGGILLILGLLTRVWAGLFILEMVGAILFVHLPHGWDVFAGGFEYNIALILLLAAVLLLGPGPLSVEGALNARRAREGFTEREESIVAGPH